MGDFHADTHLNSELYGPVMRFRICPFLVCNLEKMRLSVLYFATLVDHHLLAS